MIFLNQRLFIRGKLNEKNFFDGKMYSPKDLVITLTDEKNTRQAIFYPDVIRYERCNYRVVR